MRIKHEFLLLVALVANAAHALTKEAVIAGSVNFSDHCQPSSTIVWVSHERQLLYQAELPPKGTFSFHVVPGNYNIVATSRSGCLTESKLDIADGQTKRVDMVFQK